MPHDRANALMPLKRIENRILQIRSQPVLLDIDLASLFGVRTKRLNEQVKRNVDRFPKHFRFRLTQEEKDQVVANCDHLESLRFSPNLPYAFTEYGTLQAANVLSSKTAIRVSIVVIEAFVELRKVAATHEQLIAQVAEHGRQIGYLFDLLQELTAPTEPENKNPIGFIWPDKT